MAEIPPVRPDLFNAARAVIASIDDDPETLGFAILGTDQRALVGGLIFLVRLVGGEAFGDGLREWLVAEAVEAANDNAS